MLSAACASIAGSGGACRCAPGPPSALACIWSTCRVVVCVRRPRGAVRGGGALLPPSSPAPPRIA
eukprot:4591993-Heterocapsa_arctica.AAC.1